MNEAIAYRRVATAEDGTTSFLRRDAKSTHLMVNYRENRQVTQIDELDAEQLKEMIDLMRDDAIEHMKEVLDTLLAKLKPELRSDGEEVQPRLDFSYDRGWKRSSEDGNLVVTHKPYYAEIPYHESQGLSDAHLVEGFFDGIKRQREEELTVIYKDLYSAVLQEQDS